MSTAQLLPPDTLNNDYCEQLIGSEVNHLQPRRATIDTDLPKFHELLSLVSMCIADNICVILIKYMARIW